MRTIKTLLQWTEPDGKTRHEPGEIAVIDESVIFDLADLIHDQTVEDITPPTSEDERADQAGLG